MAKVELRIIDKDKWHGKKGEDSFGRDAKCQVLVNPETNKYATGLTEEETIEYSKILGVDLSDKFDREEPHPTWSSNSWIITLGNKTQIFDTDKPKDFVIVAILKASKFVANSMKEYELGMFPFATHVIDDETKEIERKASKIQAKQMAYGLITKLSAEDKCDIIQILSGKSIRGKSQSFLDVEIDALLEEKPQELIKYCKMPKEDVFLHALILEALFRNILTKEGNNICFMGDILAMSEEDAIAYFKDPNNQKLKMAVLGKMGQNRNVKQVTQNIIEQINNSIDENAIKEINKSHKTENVNG